MESKALTSIPGIEYYPVVSLLMFFALFAVLLLWFFRADQARLDTLAQAPLEGDSTSNTHQTYA